ncbi:hypothetical protein K438DRAFT_1959703 [Mycena galopus ATCC 62051]|nr:hypothetical protein K438DRAFT_1959703 [Mycena galopus ATCC 62051]
MIYLLSSTVLSRFERLPSRRLCANLDTKAVLSVRRTHYTLANAEQDEAAPEALTASADVFPHSSYSTVLVFATRKLFQLIHCFVYTTTVLSWSRRAFPGHNHFILAHDLQTALNDEHNLFWALGFSFYIPRSRATVILFIVLKATTSIPILQT